MSADVFISHSSQDKDVADRMCAFLESRGLRCWIAPRNIKVGSDWGAGIMDGISSSRAMVLILSSRSNDSESVKDEVAQAVNRSLPIIPFKIEDVALSGFMELNLRRRQWQNAIAGSMEEHFQQLGAELDGLLREGKKRSKGSGGRRPVKPLQGAPAVPVL